MIIREYNKFIKQKPPKVGDWVLFKNRKDYIGMPISMNYAILKLHYGNKNNNFTVFGLNKWEENGESYLENADGPQTQRDRDEGRWISEFTVNKDYFLFLVKRLKRS